MLARSELPGTMGAAVADSRRGQLSETDTAGNRSGTRYDNGRDEAVSIQEITKDQLRRMGDQEGLVLQGCGGDLQEWLDGINEILTEEGFSKRAPDSRKPIPSNMMG